MPVRNRKTSSCPPGAANLAAEVQRSLHPTRVPRETRGASEERRKQAKP
jgi:hypothetical protein